MVPTTVVSSPGKVLIAGGYLILDPAYSGIVVSTSSRFYTVCQDHSPREPNRIRVRSPQFDNAEWEYTLSFNPSPSVQPNSTKTENKFVHLALHHTLTLAAEIIGVSSLEKAFLPGLDIFIVGDNDFYSQSAKLADLKLSRTIESLSKLSPFLPTGTSLADVHKTGLGSSAALITSLVTSLLIHLNVVPDSSFRNSESMISSEEERCDLEGKHLAHNLAQFVHCLAQGKVGSGFDVAAAVFGSQLYTRFNPSAVRALLENEALTSQSLLPVLSPKNEAWDYRIESFTLPPLTRIMLAEVTGGSDTPTLAGNVLKWRKEKAQESDVLWKSLNRSNQSLYRALLQLSNLYGSDPKNYESAVKYISSLQPVQWQANPWQPPAELPIVALFAEVHEILQSNRAQMKEMGNLAEVPIEPPEQTKLLDACVFQAGVIGGGVPGAGGFDAIWVLVCDPVDSSPDQRPSERIERLWSKYEDSNVCPLIAVESIGGGTRLEILDNVPGLMSAIKTR